MGGWEEGERGRDGKGDEEEQGRAKRKGEKRRTKEPLVPVHPPLKQCHIMLFPTLEYLIETKICL